MMNPIGHNCHLQMLGSGRIVVTSGNTGLHVVDGRYQGAAPFRVIRRAGAADVVVVEPTVEDSVTSEITASQPKPTWIPSLGFAFAFDGAIGEFESYDINAEFFLASAGVVPPSPDLNYIWNETTTFSVEIVFDGIHTWTQDAQADGTIHYDPETYVQSAPTEEQVTTVVISIYAPGSVVVFQIQFEYQLALTGSSPLTQTVLYQLPGSAFV